MCARYQYYALRWLISGLTDTCDNMSVIMIPFSSPGINTALVKFIIFIYFKLCQRGVDSTPMQLISFNCYAKIPSSASQRQSFTYDLCSSSPKQLFVLNILWFFLKPCATVVKCFVFSSKFVLNYLSCCNSTAQICIQCRYSALELEYGRWACSTSVFQAGTHVPSETNT